MKRIIWFTSFFLMVLAAIPAVSPACTPTTVCDYITASCSNNTAADPAYPMTINRLSFSYSKTDPAAVSSCTGNNGTVSCHGGTTAETTNVLPAPAGFCTFSPADRLPTTVTCRYRTSTCVTACTASHVVCI